MIIARPALGYSIKSPRNQNMPSSNNPMSQEKGFNITFEV